LECIRRRPWLPYAAAEETRAAFLHCLCHGKRLFTILDRARPCDNREFVPSNGSIADVHDRLLWTQIERDQLVRFSDANDFCDTGQVFKTPAVDGTFVTGNANSCSRGSRHWMRTKSYCLNNIDHRIDLVRRGAGFHYNQHMG